MTPRERLFRALDGQPTKQVPVWLLFPWHPTGYYVDVRTHPGYRRIFDLARDHGVIALDRRGLSAPLHTADVTVIEPEDGKLLRCEEDIEGFCALPIEEDPAVIEAALAEHLPQYRREAAEFPRDCGAMMLDLGSPINVIYHNAVLEEFACWSLTHGELIANWLDLAMRRLEIVYRWCLERELADVYFLVGSELAAPPLVSRATFQRWVVPYEKRIIELVHSYGKRVIQHFHGQIRDLLPDFAVMAPDGLHTIEAPPVGNCTLDEAFRLTGGTITLIGNIQYDEFRSSIPEQMRHLVRQVLAEVAGRRFILSPTAGPFDPDPPARLFANYAAFIEAAGG